MKEVLYFIKWHWDKMSVSQRIWLLGCAFFGASIPAYIDGDMSPWQSIIAFTIWGVVFLKWFIWDTTKHSFQTFRKEKTNMFNTIKESEHASKSN